MRLFIALNLPVQVRESLHAAVAPLRIAAPGARWTPPEKVHLTLEFLGERSDELLAPLAAAIDAVAARHRAIPLVLRGTGAFPNFRRPRVVWVGIEASPELTRLHSDLSEACAALGLPQENRPFRPHVTLARVAPRTPRAEIHTLAQVAPSIDIGAVTVARTLDLMQSAAGRYTIVHAAPFA